MAEEHTIEKVCDVCGKTIQVTEEDEKEAQEEYKRMWPQYRPEERAVTCETCYRGLEAWGRMKGIWPK